MLTLDDVNLSGVRVLVREDLNVPVKDGVIASHARIRAALPTLQRLLDANAAVLVASHLGRPTEGQFDKQYSLSPVAKELERLLNTPVRLVNNYLEGVEVEPGKLVLLENVRFNVGEKADDQALAKSMANLCDIFVMDAFGTAHRAQASTHGVANFAPIACAGPLLVAELTALGQALEKPATPVVAIVGGAKVSTKLEVIGSLSNVADEIVVGGGIANTFLAAAGFPVGKSLYEPDLLDQAKSIMAQVTVPLPVDVVVAKSLDASSPGIVRLVADVAEDEMILDVGPETARQLAQTMESAGTIIWNGPLGVFEMDQFGEGTRVMAQAIAKSSAFSLAGGGDTLAAIEKYQVGEKLSYISTGGGAFLEFVEGKTLPAVKRLQERAKH